MRSLPKIATTVIIHQNLRALVKVMTSMCIISFSRKIKHKTRMFVSVFNNISLLNRVFKGYYKDDVSLPIYKTGTNILSQEKKVKALLRPYPQERLCQIIPRNISNNVTFLLDVSTSCKSWDDWKCDDMGAWRNNGVKRNIFSHVNGVVKARQQGDESSKNGTAYTLIRMYYKNKTSDDLKKCVSYLEGNSLIYFVF